MDSVHFLNVEYLFLWIYNAVKNFDPATVINWIVAYILTPIRPYAVIFTILFFILIVYCLIRIRQIEKGLRADFEKSKQSVPALEGNKDLSEKWQKVETHINSSNASDWRTAIIEADIMLGDLLQKMGYHGDTIGDKLKAVDPSSMLTLETAWEAHKVRNAIAHKGTGFQLNEREAKATIALFKKVFEEFFYI